MKQWNKDYKVDYIFHLSDIHIRLYHRLEDEYEYVFQQMYQQLQQSQERKETCLIVLTGDILHHKNDLSPECILTTLKFLNTLSSYYPTLLIAGNHDTLLNNLNRIDSLSAILAENHNPHLYYLKTTGFYQYGNVLFGVSSLLDNQWATDFPPNTSHLKRIGLYHGGVGRFSTNKGFVMEGVSLQKFQGYNMVMLGDIHLHQYLDKEKRIGYAGSMIAQNFGETDVNHGVLKWKMEDASSQLIVLENPYRYCEGRLEEEFFYMDGKKERVCDVCIPEKGRMRLIVPTPLTTSLMEHVAFLKKKFPMVQFQQYRETNMMRIDKQSPQQEDETNTLSTMLEKYFQTLPKTWKDKEELKQVVMSYFQTNSGTRNQKVSHFEIQQVEFDYMFGYGANNKIDFSQFQPNQTIGIFGMNSAGKSSLIEVLFFLLFGSITRYKHGQSVPPEVIHFQQNQSFGKIVFRSHQHVYEIQKKMTRTKTKIKVEEKLFQLLSDGSRRDCSEEHRKKTDQFVISQIGTPSQFLFTNIFLQTNEQSFRSMTPKERKEFLFDILELSPLEDHYQETLSCWKEKKQVLTTLEKYLSGATMTWEILQQHEITLENLQHEKSIVQEKLVRLQKKIQKKLSLRKYCPALSLPDMERKQQEFQTQQHTLHEQEEFLKKQLTGLQTTNELWEVIESLYQKKKTIDVNVFSKKHLKYPNCPLIEDETCFRQQVYECFMRDYVETKDEEEEYFLYPDTPESEMDERTIQKRLEWLRQEQMDVETIEKEYQSCQDTKKSLEESLQKLETQWGAEWEEWDTIQKEKEKTMMMGLEFTKKCVSCQHNQKVLQECLTETRKLQERKQTLWEKISGSKEQERLFLYNLEQVEQQLVFLTKKRDQQHQWKKEELYLQHVLHNRITQEKRRLWRQKQDQKEMKRIWENLKQQQENRIVEQEIQERKQQLRLWERYNEVQEKLVRLEKEKKEWKQWTENCRHNVELDGWIANKQKEEEGLQQELQTCTEIFLQKQQEWKQQEQEFREKQEKQEQYTQLTKDVEFLQHLLHILHRDGLSMYLLEQYLPSMEERINQLLQPFLPTKKLLLRKEQKKETTSILLSMETLGRETIYLGGMEGFMVDASIKEVLAEVSVQCKSNLFLIDEGISALDRKHMENIDQFFQFLEERHSHVFIISHLKEAQQMVRHSLNIVKEGDYSRIIFT
jgi:DNA repair exonuclease SbcCD ATPase subunit